MDREKLEAWLSEGLSLEQIGAIVDRHPSTVGYWIAKHGLTANGRHRHAPRGGLTREQLEPLVERGLTLEEMASQLNRGVSTVRYWLSRLDIERRTRWGSRTPVDPDNAPLDLELECAKHGLTMFRLEGRGYYRCKRCRMERVSEWRRNVKRRLIEEFGGCCQLCGYDRCPAALQFHHLDPSLKEFSISRQGVTRAYTEVLAEAMKCVLLCGNCHAEVESGYRVLDETLQLMLRA